jgi:hypothetical protein
VDKLPDEFSSYEEAAAFWDTHDTTDYLDVSRPVKVESRLRGRHYEVEIEESVIRALRSQARQEGIKLSRLVGDMLRRELSRDRKTAP